MRNYTQPDIFFDQYTDDQRVSTLFHNTLEEREITFEFIDSGNYIKIVLTNKKDQQTSIIGQNKLEAMKNVLKKYNL